MNIQAMMKQAQALQKDMMKIKDEVDNTEFTGESSLVKVTVKGTKEVVKVEINAKDGLDADDIEMLQDMIMVAINQANDKIDETLDKKMGKFGNIPGLF
ncbi:MAG: YbaB/EbfC family nucleoid-associated protein [Bacilli bacterium]|nr:YbaB/EbfC family nucleoid-associated protein [Bacilli bacterium]